MSISNVFSIEKFRFNAKFKFNQLIITLLVAAIVPLLVPLALTSLGVKSPLVSQLLVGSLVNATLIYAALNITKIRNALFLVVIPSLITLSSGLIFGTSNKNLLYMTLFIWLGNLSLIAIIKLLHLFFKQNLTLAVLISGLVKSLLIFSGLQILLKSSVIAGPAPFIQAFSFSMGIMQFATCITGGLIVLPIVLIYSRKFKEQE